MSAGGFRQIRFLRLDEVVGMTGLSKSEIYRRISDGRFPQSRAYRDSPKKRFWTSVEVELWQREQIGEDEFEALLR